MVVNMDKKRLSHKSDKRDVVTLSNTDHHVSRCPPFVIGTKPGTKITSHVH